MMGTTAFMMRSAWWMRLNETTACEKNSRVLSQIITQSVRWRLRELGVVASDAWLRYFVCDLAGLNIGGQGCVDAQLVERIISIRHFFISSIRASITSAESTGVQPGNKNLSLYIVIRWLNGNDVCRASYVYCGWSTYSFIYIRLKHDGLT